MNEQAVKAWSISDRDAEMIRRAEEVFGPRPPFPKNIMVELSNACNHACVFCANPKMTRRKKRMTPGLVSRILGEARALGTTEVGFYTTGDPFIHTGLVRFIAEAKALGYEYVYLSTNGALATPKRLVAAIDAGLDSIKFSINAGSRVTYAAIHGSDDWDKVMSHLSFVADHRRTIGRPLRLAVSYVVTAQNRHEVDSFSRLVEGVVDDVHFSEVDCQQGYMYENRELLTLAPPRPVAAPCHMLFSRAHVTAEGFMTLCCVDYQNYLAVADVNEMSLKEAWLHPLFVAMRERHLRDDLGGTLCANCLHARQDPIEPLVREYATPMEFDSASGRNLEVQKRRTAFLPILE